MEASNKRNSLIEIYRFVFAIFIALYHNFFIFENTIFGRCNYFVDFFFLITGFYMIPTLAHYETFSPIKGCFKIIFDKLKKFGIPLLVSFIAVLIADFTSTTIEISIHYLWFIGIMLVVYGVFFLLYKLIKNTKTFYIVIGIIGVIAFILRYLVLFVPIELFDDMYYFDELRCVLMVPVGMFLRLLPKVTFKNEKDQKEKVTWYVIACFILIAIGIGLTNINMTVKRCVEIAMDLIVFPALFYFTLYIDYSNKKANLLGMSSLYIYIYQCVCALERHAGVDSQFLYFITLVSLTILTMAIETNFYHLKDKIKRALKD